MLYFLNKMHIEKLLMSYGRLEKWSKHFKSKLEHEKQKY